MTQKRRQQLESELEGKLQQLAAFKKGWRAFRQAYPRMMTRERIGKTESRRQRGKLTV